MNESTLSLRSIALITKATRGEVTERDFILSDDRDALTERPQREHLPAVRKMIKNKEGEE